ncbi:conserved Plasmodium protein, unknown function [Plasmodium knowlesi strain H]|uniref:DUF2892 domain-containing protein n=3 Tax=Plasmodium knowlesi TaxID=5850 RepID=A0A5K1UL98_PLAKH|nr:uncharacterized protein PKNH_0909700 [Plasmodium knowlesi strain H]OTN64945.1 Uncharacterized protein PKNOH_S120128100 [Plasmodium knowlesi]CAA9988144.1 conserved protein, unknown function [Plasmodium knowlesi strain H]SBO20040.1 conserved Plasmodium protein, unknown function [Plasmodium knowlesi strain H]SBO20788.1 conserved Plasmodium protein, unknown function [Plasmodium knowlesi strain H]VVS77618.1 conserved protein, unknown function [Plasmodium knowlesi strain H]|eukprot:XP_002259120.1 [Plasmodium knowlesi strain H]
MSDKSRRTFLFGITAVLIFCSFAAVESQRYMWIFSSICASILLIIDLMFLGVDKFNYDPFYSNWEKKHL